MSSGRKSVIGDEEMHNEGGMGDEKIKELNLNRGAQR
jgi:hypothetical protein